MALNQVPDNDPDHPRWLLDLDEWLILPYQEIVLNQGGPPEYGIISYTWGKYYTGNQAPDKVPSGIMWNVPSVSAFSLEDARNVMGSMKKRYVWWDWMCVPQGSAPDISPELLQAKGQEIGKQMKIYRGAKSSIVWVHRTDWNEGSPLRTLLKDGIPPPGGDFIGFFTAISDILGEIRTTEPWLGSIWTLQEGVLLSKTALLDRHGTTLEDDRFIHNGGKASVIDLTAGLTGLVIRVAAAFMRLSNPEDAKDEDAPDVVLIEFLKQADNYVYVAGVLATIMRSGLVAYAQDSPLYVLSGKISRLSSEPEDYCWALLGALDLELANTWYNKGRDMDRVKAMFFQKLLERWQWPLFLVARVSNPVEYDVLSWPERIVDGKMLPLGIYFDVFWKNNLPALSWIDNGKDKTQPDMIILDNTKSDQACAFWKLAQPGLSRVYEQTSIVEETNAMVQIRPVGELLPAENRLYLPITDLGPQFERPGARCIEIESLDENTGRFLGVVDLWVAEEDVVQVTFADFRLLGRMV